MGRPRKATPTDGELKILKVMWRLGQATLRDIREAIPDPGRPSPSALADAIAVMLHKNFVRLAYERRPQKFEAVFTQEQTYQTIVTDLRKRIFGGSLRDLVRHALSGKRSAEAELDELKLLVKELGEEQSHAS